MREHQEQRDSAAAVDRPESGESMHVSNTTFVVTIDGPAGSGKSTVARLLAKRLSAVHLNSGLLFRAVGLLAKQRGLPLDDDSALTALAKSLSFKYVPDDEGYHLAVDGWSPGAALTTPEASQVASVIAVHPRLREVLLEVQRDVARTNSIVVEGRDAGTVVFPDAPAKFFLTADLEERARRRLSDYAAITPAAGQSALAAIMEDMRARDERDSTRAVAPQVAADDALVVDTTTFTPEQVVEELLAVLAGKGLTSM